MKPGATVSPLPYVLLGAMTLVSFAGPFIILLVVRGGASRTWPPENLFEWITTGLVLALAITLFLTCVSIRLWYPLASSTKESQKH
jgi:hypothetical protein